VTPESALAAVPAEALEGFDRQTLSPCLNPHSSGLNLVVGATRPEEGEAVTGDHVRAALGAMKRQFMAIVVDCGGTFNDPTLAALEMADRVVLVCTPELNTLRDVRECQRIFGEVIHVDRAKLYYVLNHYQPFKVLTREQFEAALEQNMALEIPHAGEVAMKAAMDGSPLVLSNAGTPFAKAIEKVSWDLQPEEARAPKGRPRSLSLAAAAGANDATTRPKSLLGLLRRS
jgi:pilus assembly protein CpaE